MSLSPAPVASEKQQDRENRGASHWEEAATRLRSRMRRMNSHHMGNTVLYIRRRGLLKIHGERSRKKRRRKEGE